MGVDLTLLPISHGRSSYTVLELNRSPELWMKIQELERVTVDDDYVAYASGFDSLRTSGQDRYGRVLCSVMVKQLLTLREDPDVKDDYTNRAAWAYLAELSPKSRVVLFWH